MSENRIAINVALNPKLASMLDALVVADTKFTGVEMDRSKVVKRLIRQEFLRRKNTGRVIPEHSDIENTNRPAHMAIES